MAEPRPIQPAPARALDAPLAGKHAVLIGLGIIGSHLNNLLACTEAVTRLTLVDRDAYEAANLGQQAIEPEDVCRPKVIVQAERARRIRPDLQIEAIHAAVEDVPIGRLRGDVVLTGLDSKLSRQQVNQRVWRMGIPWVDAGVRAADSLVRVTVYVPGENRPCLECAWGERDYQTLEVKRPCLGEGGAPTGAPAYLGSLAAALQMAECARILAADWSVVPVGRQITMAVGAQRLYETTFRQNPNCRFDHCTRSVHPLPYDLHVASIDDLFTELSRTPHGGPVLRLFVEGKRFERLLQCSCGKTRNVLCVEGRMTAVARACADCGELMAPVGFSSVSFLDKASLLSGEREQSLADLGLRHGDFITVQAGLEENLFELIAK